MFLIWAICWWFYENLYNLGESPFNGFHFNMTHIQTHYLVAGTALSFICYYHISVVVSHHLYVIIIYQWLFYYPSLLELDEWYVFSWGIKLNFMVICLVFILCKIWDNLFCFVECGILNMVFLIYCFQIYIKYCIIIWMTLLSFFFIVLLCLTSAYIIMGILCFLIIMVLHGIWCMLFV